MYLGYASVTHCIHLNNQLPVSLVLLNSFLHRTEFYLRCGSFQHRGTQGYTNLGKSLKNEDVCDPEF